MANQYSIMVNIPLADLDLPSQASAENRAILPNKKRARTQADRTERDLLKYPMKSSCGPQCKLSCSDCIDESHRIDIHKAYWNMEFVQKRQWLDSYIKLKPVDRRYVSKADQEYRKKQTLMYSLPKPDGQVQVVCRTMFKNTLGFINDNIIQDFVRAKTEHSQGSITPTVDGRGKHTPRNKIDSQSIVDHINSYNPQSSHYTRAHAPNRRYLEGHISIRSKLCFSVRKLINVRKQ